MDSLNKMKRTEERISELKVKIEVTQPEQQRENKTEPQGPGKL